LEEKKCTQGVSNGCDDSFDILIDLGRPEPEHAKAHFVQPFISPCIVCKLIAMMVAIHFDHQLRAQAGKVDEVGTNRKLPSKLASHELPAAQAVPEPPFDPGHLPPQMPSSLIPNSPIETGLTNHGCKLSEPRGDRKAGC
jgi:hypothetical protein